MHQMLEDENEKDELENCLPRMRSNYLRIFKLLAAAAAASLSSSKK